MIDNIGQEFYVENIFEELNSDNEWYYNTTTNMLYYYLNTSKYTNINDLLFEAVQLKNLLNLNNVTNITINNVSFIDTGYIYMNDHGIISGSDWTLPSENAGVINIANSTDVTIRNCLFNNIGGIPISITEYNRNVYIYRNEFQ